MRVLIIDDHPLYREGLKALLFGLQPDIETVDVASVAAALMLVNTVAPPDLVLLDMGMPGTSHLDALRQVRAAFDGASIVVISGEEDADFILETIDAGAAGYIPKSTDPAVTIQALRLVLAHGVYLPAAALRHLPGARAAPSPRPELSERQWAVLQRLLQGKANKIIARELEIAEGTVKAHLWAIYQALGVASRTQAMFRAHELHLFGSAEPSRR
ncbi:MAG: response regulator transcription factor [Pseudomonadota bacterium]